jgi:predicted alpha/beta-hydrolase family hydrolase
VSFVVSSGPAKARFRLILAHGAGAGATSAFLASIAELLARRGIAVTRFEFGYMAARRDGGRKRPPPRAETLTSEFQARLVPAPGETEQALLIGGKSLGGRVASLVADELYVSGKIVGLVCLGYPFHPPGEPDRLRTDHLAGLRCPALIVQGDRDPFGNRAEVEAMTLAPQITIQWIGDGDHDFGPRGRSGFTRNANLAVAADAVAGFIDTLSRAR